MGDLTNYLKTQNVNPNDVLIPTNNQKFFPVYNQTGNSNLIDLDYQGDSNLRSLDNERNDIRAKTQSGFDKVLNSTGQMVGTFGTALASSVASLTSGAVGLGAETADAFMDGDQYNGMDIMLNNPIMKGISDFDKYIKEEIVPTYYTKDQQDRVFSAATGTDLLNGLGFMASAVLPSQAITKLFGSMAKMVAASKLNKLEPILENAIKFGDITSTEAGMISKTAKYLNQAGPIVGATIGRIGESSMEAYQTYESMLANGATEEEAKQGRNNVFMGNMALAASDLAQYTRWFKGASLGDDLVKQGLGTAVKDKTKGKIIGDLLKEAGQEAAEEGYQFLLSKGAEKATKGKSFIEGISEASGDLFTTTEGLKSMLLGAVLGGGVGGALQARNSKKQKENLSAMANELTANADTTQRFITDPNTGKQVVNPELTKIATTFAFYENQKERALAAGDQKSYDIAEKMQFSELVEAKNRAGQFDEFIDQLEEMGRSNPEEIKSMFGNLPIKNGREMTPMQVATEKIQQAKQIKQLAEGLDLLPQLTKIRPDARSFIKNKLFAQEALREEILNIDSKIAEVNSRVKSPIFTGSNVLEQPELLPQDQFELDNLIEQKKDLTDNYIEISKEFKDLIAKPKKAEEEVDNIQNTNIKEAVDNEIEKNNKETVNTTEAIVNNTPLVIDGEDVTIIDKDENGNPIAVNTEGEQFITDKQTVSDAVETKKQEEVDEVLAHEYDENEEIITIHTGSPKKASINSTSTKGQDEEFRNKIPEVVDGVTIYKFNDDHIKTVKYLANPENTPSPENPGEYTVRLTLEDENNITDSEHEVDKYKILYHIFKNGKQVTFDTTHFHEVAYFKKTSTYEKLKAENSEDANKEIERIEAQLIKDRQEIVDTLKQGYTVELICKNKSGGIQNFNPQVDGVNQVQPIDKTFGPVDGSKYKTNGIGVITKIENDTTFIKYQYATIPYQGKVNIGVPGQIVFETVDAANQIYVTNGITMNRHTPETINSLTELIVYTLTTQNNTIKKGKEEFELINDRKSGLLDGLLYLGNRSSKKNRKPGSPSDPKDQTELFIKNNTIRMGKTVVTVTPETNIEELKAQINTFLTAYHAFPAFKPNVLGKKLILPDSIDEDGNVNKEAKVQSFTDFLFKGDRPLIGTNVNSQVPFINSYMNYETNPDGSLMFKTNKKEKPIVKYAEELKSEPVNKTDELENKKADIERRLGIKLPAKNTSVPVSPKTWGDRKSLANQISSELKGVVERGVSMQEWLDKGYGRQLTTWSDETIIEFLEVADIERRRQEELNIPIENFKNAKTKEDLIKAGQEWMGVNPYDAADSPMSVRSALLTTGGFEKGKELFIDFFKKANEIRTKQINAKYDAELAALEKTENQEVVNKTDIKPGVSEIFNENSELANIGTQEQYSQYLSTIFPDSKVKDIVYHSTNATIEKFKEGITYFTQSKTHLSNYGKNKIAAILNIKNPSYSDDLISYGKIEANKNNDAVILTERKYNSILNKEDESLRLTSNPNITYKQKEDGSFVEIDDLKMTFTPITKEKYSTGIVPSKIDLGSDNFIQEVAVFEPEQIHILGSKQDLEGFKEFVNNNIVETELPDISNTQPANKIKVDCGTYKVSNPDDFDLQ